MPQLQDLRAYLMICMYLGLRNHKRALHPSSLFRWYVMSMVGPAPPLSTKHCSTVRILAATGGGGGGAIQAGAGSCSPTRPGRTISAMHILLRPRHVMSFVISWVVEVAPPRPHSYCIPTTAVSPIAATSWWGKTEWLQQCRPAMRSRPCSSYSYMFAIRTCLPLLAWQSIDR